VQRLAESYPNEISSYTDGNNRPPVSEGALEGVRVVGAGVSGLSGVSAGAGIGSRGRSAALLFLDDSQRMTGYYLTSQ